MSSLRCRHGTTTEQAIRIIKSVIKKHGYSNHVKWDGHNASVSIGFGTLLHIKGRVTDMEVIMECGGVFSNVALNRCREMVGGIFPGGKVAA